MTVVLPAPLAPSNPTTWPGSTRTSTASTAVKEPNLRVTARVSASGPAALGAGARAATAAPLS